MRFKEIAETLKETFGPDCKTLLSDPESEIKTLLIDSRNFFKPEETLFFAIRTPHGNDGHNYIGELYEKGVRNFIAEKIPDAIKEKRDYNIILVKDVVKALSTIGQKHRENAEIIVAVAGSRGKTTLKEIIYQLLEPFKRISRSPRSFNSRIGVPLSLWQISPFSEIAVIEAGISQKGEMENLENLIHPDIVIFTNIGNAHSEGFDSLQQKAEEKALLASGDKVRIIIYPEDDQLLSEALQPYMHEKRVINWSLKDSKASLYISEVVHQGKDKTIIRYIWEGKENRIEIPFSKDFEIENAIGALAFMLSQNIDHQKISQRFSSLHQIGTRLNVVEGTNGCSIILDSYTSDFSSLIPALDFMRRRKMPGQTMTLVLSDLSHETENIEQTLRNILKIIKESEIKRFIGIGKIFRTHLSLFPEDFLIYSDTKEFLKDLPSINFCNEILLLKGSPEYNFIDIVRELEARQHETVLEVNLDAMIRNYNYFREKIPSSTGIITMVKAFGYGVGSKEIAKTLQDAGASYLAVAVVDEGIELRENGIIMPVMIMNPQSSNHSSLFNFNLEPVIYSESLLTAISQEAEKRDIKDYPIHIKLDTGMHRMGFLEEDTKKIISLLKKQTSLKVSTILSHLATADCLDMDNFTLNQINTFERISSQIIEGLGYPVRRHILNSAGIIRFPQYHYELVRLGIGLYGVNTLPKEIETPLSVVASLKTPIICIREIKTGEAVGYGRKGIAHSPMKIATLPVGYADGIDRRFGNGNLTVTLNGIKVPTIGNICMDATMIDVTNISCKEGDMVEIFGENQTLQTLSDTLDTIPYEILTSVSPRVKRVYYRE